MTQFFPFEIPHPPRAPEIDLQPKDRLKNIVGFRLSQPQPYRTFDTVRRGEQVPNAQTLLFAPFGSGENMREMPIVLSGFGDSGRSSRLLQIELCHGVSRPPLNPELFYRGGEWWTYPYDSKGELSGPEIPVPEQEMTNYAAWLESEAVRPATLEEVATFVRS